VESQRWTGVQFPPSPPSAVVARSAEAPGQPGVSVFLGRSSHGRFTRKSPRSPHTRSDGPVVKPRRHFIEVVLEQISVGVECHGRRLMPQHPLHGLHICTRTDRQARRRVAQIVRGEPLQARRADRFPEPGPRRRASCAGGAGTRRQRRRRPGRPVPCLHTAEQRPRPGMPGTARSASPMISVRRPGSRPSPPSRSGSPRSVAEGEEDEGP